MKLVDLKTAFARYFVIKDERILEVIMASVLGNLLVNRDPLWVFIVAPSSGGKSTLLAPIVSIPSIHFVDDLTEKTLLSGFKIKGKEMSLLKVIGSGILAFSDFTSILAKNPMSRNEILGQLRLVYDGIFTKQTGTGKIEWRGKMGVTAACTPDIYGLLESVRSAGERFIFYWLEQPTDDEIINKQQEVQMSSKEITAEMKDMYLEYYNGVRAWVEENGIPELSMTPAQRATARFAAIMCVNGKTTVHTDFKSGKADSIPNKAGVGRDAKMFDTMLHTLQIMNCYENDNVGLPVQDWMLEVVEKCAYSSINRERRKILEILCTQEEALPAAEIGAFQGLGLEKESVEKYLIPLHSIGLIRKRAGSGKFRWYIEDVAVREFVNRVSEHLKETMVVSGIEAQEEEAPQGDLLEEFHAQNEVLGVTDES